MKRLALVIGILFLLIALPGTGRHSSEAAGPDHGSGQSRVPGGPLAFADVFAPSPTPCPPTSPAVVRQQGRGGSESTRTLYLKATDLARNAVRWKGKGNVAVASGIVGDVDADCDVDIVDIMLVAGRYSAELGDPRYDQLYDLDHSGNIGAVDISGVTSHWNETCPVPPPPIITVELQRELNGYSGAEDTSIYRYDADVNYYGSATLRVGQTQRWATLLRFDLSSIPSNAVVTDATLEVYATGWGGTDVGINAYVVLRPTTLIQATWNRAQSGNEWAVAGCDNTSTDRRATAESGVMTSGFGKWYTFPVTPVVREWVSGSLANNGFLLRAPWIKYADRVNFASSEYSDVGIRPRLVLTYYIPNGWVPAPSLVIGHITDLHVGGTAAEERVAPALGALSGQAQVMVDTGDCTQNGTVDQTIAYWELISANTTVLWRAVPGNHDDLDTFAGYLGPLEWSWDVGGYRLIGINASAINYTALDQALTTDKICIIFGHHPLSVYSAADQAALRQRFSTYHIPLYVAGHVHEDSLETDPQTGTVLLVGQYGSLGQYRLITLSGSNVSVIFF